MNFFGFNKEEKNNKFRITEADRLWVEVNFSWLIKVFGYPQRNTDQILLSERYFPNTFHAEKILIENIIGDLCQILNIPESKVSFEFFSDIRDAYNVPYEIEGNPFDTDFEILEGSYRIYIASSLQKNSKRLIYNLVYEFIKIKLTDNKLEFDTGEDTSLFIYLAGIYFGFGFLLAQSLKETGSVNDGFWETKWNYISEMPYEIMAFSLAIYSKLIELDAPKWKERLPIGLKQQFEGAKKYLDENPTQLYEKMELEANDLFNTANNQYLNNEFEEAISTLQKILFLTQDDIMKAEVFNDLGYYSLRLRNFEQSIKYFEKCIQIIPNYGYANDNLGYAFIQVGKLEEGNEWLKKALKTETNDVAYSYRNFALYYQAKGDMKKAEDYFEKAFKSLTQPVDLLEYHYADFLLQIGKKEECYKFLKVSVEKGEPEGIEKWNELR
jgi:tetratricopeptide (TPR) repeat protein